MFFDADGCDRYADTVNESSPNTPATQSPPAPQSRAHTPRLGLGSGTALYIASVLGTGILVLPGLTAEVAGPGSLIAVLVIFVLSIPMAGTFAVLASRFPDPGGVASYARRALGDTVARATGYWFYFGVALGIPVLMVLGAEYVSAVAGLPRELVPWLALAVWAPPFVINWFGVHVAGWVQFVLTALLLVVVVLVGVVALPAVDTANMSPLLPNGWGGVGTAISMFVWAFAGWEVGTHIAGEFANPRRVIPWATAIALVVVGVSYFVLQWVTIGVLGSNHEWGAVPLLDLMTAVAPGIAPVIVGIIALIVSLGVLNSYLPAFGKLGAALAEQGDLPRWMIGGAASGEIPRRALAVTGVIGLAYFGWVSLSGFDLAPFILLHTANMVSIYAVGMLAATILLRRRSAEWWMALVATVLSGGLLVLAGTHLVIPAGLALVAVIVGLARKRPQGTEGVDTT